MERGNSPEKELLRELESLQRQIAHLAGCKARLRKVRRRIRHLASYPQLNPSPILDLDSSGTLLYRNKAASELLRSVGRAGGWILLLPGDFGDILESLRKGERKLLYREVAIGGLVFADYIYLVPQLRLVRIYAYDISRFKKAQGALAEAEENLRTILNNVHDALFIHNLDGSITDVNRKALELYRVTREEALSLSIANDYSAPGSPVEVLRALWERVIAGESRLVEWKARRPGDGSVFDAEVFLSRITLHDKNFVLATVRDITERKNMEETRRRAHDVLELRVRERTAELAASNEKLRESERSKQLIIDSVPALIAYVDSGQRYLFVNRQFAAYYHLPAAEILGRQVSEVLGETLYRAIKEHITAALAGERVSYERRDTLGSETRYLQVEYIPHRGEDGAVAGIFTFMHDITETKRIEEFMRHQASHDPLTGLPNRALFLDHLTLELAQSHRTRRILAVLFLDLDRFKEVNDTLGHEAGDHLLREVGARLKACLRESDTVARIGGDEFTILLTDIERMESVAVTVRKIITVVREPFIIKGHTLSATASIGVSLYPDDGADAEVLIRNADTAMYHAKEQGRNRYRFYNPEMSARDAERMLIEQGMRHMVERREWVLYYQPQVEVKTRRIVSAEALLRWQHPEKGMLPPARFIPLAEETGVIMPLGETVLHAACAQNKAWQEAGYPPLRMTVNLSARQFRQADIVEQVAGALRGSRLRPEFLELEIAESTALQDADYTAATLKNLSALGVRVSLDDFGRGCTSLRNLKKLPLQKIKIDLTLIAELTRDPDYRTLVGAVLAMAHALGLEVAAEGVETDEQLSILTAGLCDEAQGYLFGRPLSPQDFEQLLALPGY
ncbi:MAG: EAL domain-containing protein [Thermodesulfovibrionales bacterium]